ncbi:MAG: hypothetical protein Q9201_005523 [Fulgogasparrea decipioides]
MEEDDELRQRVLTNTFAEDLSTPLVVSEIPDTCVICLDTISERAVTSPCKHESFDFLCLVSWLQECRTCPLCKTEVLAVDYGWQSSHGHKTYDVPRSQSPKEATASTTRRHWDNSNLRRLHPWPNARPRRPARPSHIPNPDVALLRRRQIYARGLYSLHVGTNRLSRYRDLTPQLFSRDEELIRRARKWIRRELQVFVFLSMDGANEEDTIRRTDNAEFLLEYMVAILRTVDIKGSGGQAEDMLQDFLGRANAQLFLHELKAWLRSPYTSLEDWDRHVQYTDNAERVPNMAKNQPTELSPNNLVQSKPARSTTTSISTSPQKTIKHRSSGRYEPYSVARTVRRERTYDQRHDHG